MSTIDVVAVSGSVLILGAVVGLIVRGSLKPRYALLWLAASSALVTVSLWRGLIDIVGGWLDLAYRPALVFLAADVFLSLILLHMSTVASRQTDRIRSLAQELALLRREVERLTGEAVRPAERDDAHESG